MAAPEAPAATSLGEGAVWLHGAALDEEVLLLGELARVTALAPFRHMTTPGGYRMSVAMTNCGRLGWVSDRKGYRYAEQDPESGRAWPAMPEVFLRLARRCAAAVGFADFIPDACLINRYEAGAKLALHQDKDESDFSQPIVSVSLGLAATFLFGGMKRSDPTRKLRLEHGDVVVWGGASRLRYHGVAALRPGLHPWMGPMRVNLTFRKAR